MIRTDPLAPGINSDVVDAFRGTTPRLALQVCTPDLLPEIRAMLDAVCARWNAANRSTVVGSPPK